MARRGLRKTSGRGHKWKKGHSCVSNPEVTKHRQAARGTFFQRLDGTSSLTQTALSDHNKALMNLKEDRMNSEGEEEEEEEEEVEEEEEMTEMEKQMKELGVEEEDIRSTGGRSYNTFATSFTTCSLPAFERFFRSFEPSSDQHTRMLAIHAAAEEYLKDTGTPQTATSYFCSLMVSLEGVRDSEADTAATLALLTRVARHVAKEVLVAKFGVFAATLLATLQHHTPSDNSRLIANAIGSLSILLRAQERGEWTNASTLDIFNTIMGFSVHPKPKIRRAGQYNTAAILSTSTAADSTARHPAAAAAAEFCLVNLRRSTEDGNAKTTLHTMVLLRQIIAFLPKKQLKAVCECLLSIMQVGQSLINTSALQALHALFAAHPPPEVLPAHTNTALLHALTQGASGGAGVVIPGKNDPQMASVWITVVTMGLVNLFRLSEETGMVELHRWVEVLMMYLQSHHNTVITKVRESVVVLLQDSVGVCGEAVRGGAAAGGVFEVLCGGLSLQYQPAWGQVFLCLAAAFPALGPHQPRPATSCLASLCQLMANPRLPHRPALQAAIGAAVAALGPGPLLDAVPPLASGDVAQDEASWWTLPLLRRHVRDAGLGEFVGRLLPLAGRCFQLVAALEKEGRRESVVGRAYQQVEQQVWAALPAFCRGAKDVDEALGRDGLARLLCDHLKHRPDTRPAVMEALRLMLAEHAAAPGRLATYAKNYLPALFNLYLTPPGTQGTTPGQRQAALATVEAFLAVVPPTRAAELLDLLLDRHRQAMAAGKGQEAALRRRALLNLAAALVPHLEGPPLAKLYDHVAPLLAAPEHGQQKAAYRLLEAVLVADTAATAALVEQRVSSLQAVLVEQLGAAAPSARAPRLRCLRLVLLRVGEGVEEGVRQALLQRVVGEAVVCCGRSMSQATRRAAFLLLSEVGAVVQRWEGCGPRDTVYRVLELVLAGLAGSTALAAATMLAVTALTFQHRHQVDSQVLGVLVQNTCVQLLCPARDIVASCLSFIKATTTIFPPPILAPHLPPILQAMANMTPDCQRKHRLKTRDILDRLCRKFGSDTIAELVPEGDTILHKRIRNIRKLANRKKREREERRKAAGGEEEEEEEMTRPLPASLDEILAEIDCDNDNDDDDDDEGKKKMKKKKKKRKGDTWIKEDEEEVLDLLDAGAGQAIVSGQAEAAGVRGGAGRGKTVFEVDKDSGKMIITDDDDGGGGGGGESEKMDFSGDLDEILGLKAAAAGGKVKKRKRSDSIGSAEVNEGGGGGGGGGKEVKKRAKRDPGAEFRSKKAGGDVALKGGAVAPFAYVRLAKEQLNRRKKAKFEGQFGSLVRGAKRGVRGARKGGRGRGKGRK